MKIKESFMVTDAQRQRHVRVELELAIKLVASPGITVYYKRADDRRFEPAIAFGVALVAERMPLGGTQQGVEVTVFQAQCQHIGPSTAVMAMLAARCACKALGVATDFAPRADDQQRLISIPLGS